MLVSQKKSIASMERSRKAAHRSEPRNRYRIEHTTFMLAIPFSLGAPGAKFSIGPITFELDHKKKIAKPNAPIPASWLIELQEVPAEPEAVAPATVEECAEFV